MKTEARLAKVEELAVQTLRCAWCRYTLPDDFPVGVEAIHTPDFLFIKCAWCGSAINYNMKEYDERLREALRLEHGKFAGEAYRDERVFAAREWQLARLSAKRWGVGIEKLKQNVIVFLDRKWREASSRNQYQRPIKLTGKALSRKEIKDKGIAFYRRMIEAEEKKYSPYSHTLPEQIKALEKEITKDDAPTDFFPGGCVKVTPQEKWLSRELFVCRVAKLCEGVLWSKTLPETKAAVSNLSALVARLEQKRAEEKQALLEAEEKKKQEREAQRLEREARLNPPAVSSVPVQRTSAIEFIETVDHILPVEIPEYDAQGRKRVTMPRIADPSAEVKSKVPPDDGSVNYQQKLAHYHRTGVWLLDHWLQTY